MTMESIIRLAEPKDVSGLAEVHVRTWQHAYRDQIPDDFLDGLSVEGRTSLWETWLSQLSSDSAVHVASRGATIVGFCWVGPAREGVPVNLAGELYAIYVLPDYQNEGLGSKLMTAGLNSLKACGFREATLWVLESNAPSRSFYERRGWSTSAVSKTEQWQELNLVEVQYRISLDTKN
jgi:ribosomal protein S18 acetylase RimI-like enzyme